MLLSRGVLSATVSVVERMTGAERKMPDINQCCSTLCGAVLTCLAGTKFAILARLKPLQIAHQRARYLLEGGMAMQEQFLNVHKCTLTPKRLVEYR